MDRGQLELTATVPLRAADLLDYAPVTRANLTAGSMTIEQLARAAVVVSDNTAANLLLDQIGGPAGLTGYLVELGDDVTRLDRYEPMLNLVGPGDPRDTTTPHAMAHTSVRTLAPGTLTPASYGGLREWLIACETGRDRLRAGFPDHLPAGDKTGTGENGTYNDVAVLWLGPTRMLVVACYISGATRPVADVQAAFRRIGALAVAAGANT